MIRLKEIKDLLVNWFEGHDLVKTSLYGDFIQLYNSNQIKHSSVVIYLLRTPEVTRSRVGYQFVFTYADRMFDDRRNELDIQNDCVRVFHDFVKSASNDPQLRQYITGLTTGNIELFQNRSGDMVAGGAMSITINFASDQDICEIPRNVIPSPTPVCLPVTVNVNFDELGQVLSGSTLDIQVTDFEGNTQAVDANLVGDELTIQTPQPADATYTVQYEDGTLIESGSIPSGGSVLVEVPDVITCLDANWTLEDTNGNVLDSGTIPSGGSANITAPNGLVQILRACDGSQIANVTVASGGTEEYDVPNNEISVNGDVEGEIQATEPLNVELKDDNGDIVTPTSVDLVNGVLEVEVAVPKDLTLLIPFSEDDDEAEITIVADSDGDITSVDNVGLTSFIIDKNGTPVTVPFSVAVNDELVFSFDSASSDGVIKLEGSYV